MADDQRLRSYSVPRPEAVGRRFTRPEQAGRLVVILALSSFIVLAVMMFAAHVI